jgi:hypothetical protein
MAIHVPNFMFSIARSCYPYIEEHQNHELLTDSLISWGDLADSEESAQQNRPALGNY